MPKPKTVVTESCNLAKARSRGALVLASAFPCKSLALATGAVEFVGFPAER